MSIKDFIKDKSGFNAYFKWQRIQMEQLKILNAQPVLHQVRQKDMVKSFEEVEFSVFSQAGDDGIIQYLIHKLDIKERYFVEFGVQDYIESNTRFLLLNNNWSGLIMDGSQEHIDFIQSDYFYNKYNLTARKQFITAENINQVLTEEKVPQEAGLLHIDIDGNDYWVWKAINVIQPVIVVMEYNSSFGEERAITVPYKADFERYTAHYSGLVFGASLQALNKLAIEKGYTFVGSNSYGNNAYFIRNDYVAIIGSSTVAKGFVKTNCRQNKAPDGSFTYRLDREIINEYKEVKVFNVNTDLLEPLSV